MKNLAIMFMLTAFISSCYAGTYVNGYYKKDGTYVSGHYRRSANKNSIYKTNGNNKTFAKKLKIKCPATCNF